MDYLRGGLTWKPNWDTKPKPPPSKGKAPNLTAIYSLIAKSLSVMSDPKKQNPTPKPPPKPTPKNPPRNIPLRKDNPSKPVPGRPIRPKK